MINSVLNEGVKGMQTSAREMHKAAQDIAHFNVREDNNDAQKSAVGSTTAEDQAILPVNQTEESASPGKFAEPLVELKRQELVFTASAQIIKTADDALGSILDLRS